MPFNPLKPYNDLPPLPPRADFETKEVLKKAIAAGRSIGELKGLGGLIPNQSMLVNTLILQEARASSEIENIITTNDALFRALTAGSADIDPATKEVLRYREALWTGFEALEKKPRITTALCVAAAQTLTGDSRGIRNQPGTVIANRATGAVIYTPPDGKSLILKKLKELEKFIHADNGIEPLVKLALMHYQFETIHPFFDGNGRTGRIANILFLVQQELLDLPVLYLSKYIIERKPDYYRFLRNVTEKAEWEPWIIFMLEALLQTAGFTRRRILDIRALLDETLERAKRELPERVYSKELIEILFRQPYTKGQFLVDAGIAERQTAAEYLKELEKTGILRSVKLGRENLYLNVRLFDLLAI
jgi:Fic family protein